VLLGVGLSIALSAAALIVSVAHGTSTATKTSVFDTEGVLRGSRECVFPDCIQANTLVAERVAFGGFTSAAAPALDALMANGALLNKFQTNDDATAFSAAAFLTVTARKGNARFAKTYGVDSKTKVPYAADAEVPSPFYSSTKLIANVVGMMFVERGVIDLDAPCHKYIPESHTDLNVSNVNSIKPMRVIRSVPATVPADATTVTVGGVAYAVKTRLLSAYAGAAAGVSHRYYEQPVATADYPTLRQFMTHTDGSAGYVGFAAPMWAAVSQIPNSLLPHAIVAELENEHPNCTALPHVYKYGPGSDCGGANTTLAARMAVYFDVGALVYYPGKSNHYSWSNAMVGRAVEVAHARLKGGGGFVGDDTSRRFEQICKAMLFDKVGASRSAFYALPGSDLYNDYSKTYAAGVTSTATAASNSTAFNWVVQKDVLLRSYFPNTTGAALGDLGMMSTASDYLKMLSVALDGLAPDGTRLLRASTARMLTKHYMSHVYDAEEEAYGVAKIYGSVRTLGGAVSAEVASPGKYHPHHPHLGFLTFGDDGENFLDAQGIDTTMWLGAAGTNWKVNHDDDMIFSFQTNIPSAMDATWLVNKIYGLLMLHTH
jgi:CubicO group peptidase (beta-lactamase class C family)